MGSGPGLGRPEMGWQGGGDAPGGSSFSSALRRGIVDSPRPRRAAISAVFTPATVHTCILSFSSIESSVFLTMMAVELFFEW